MKIPFDACSREYDIYRPDYPSSLYNVLIERCSLNTSSWILDAGAGTGKASVPFMVRGLRSIAIEPSLAMCAEGLRLHPTLIYVCSTAEAIPLMSSTFDVVIAGQSFHWFDTGRALPEFARLLKPSGFLGIFWNTRNRTLPHVENFERLIKTFNPKHECAYRHRDWRSTIETSGKFRVIDSRKFAFVKPMTSGDWVGLARSLSYVRSLPEPRLADFEKSLRAMLAQYSSIDCPYITEFWLAQKGGADELA